MPSDFDKFRDLKYNDVDKWESLKDYKMAIQRGDMSPLATFKDYENTKKQLDSKIIGITTKDGIDVNSYSKHFVDRVIGSVEQKRNGVEIDDIIETLTNYIDKRVMKNSVKYIGLNNAVSIDPGTHNLIQTNPLRRKE